METNGGQ
nr:unnamed protein product [Callosobruchus analis]